jgi:hypothetical protein
MIWGLVKGAICVVPANQRTMKALKENMSGLQDVRLYSQKGSMAIPWGKKAFRVALRRSWVRLAQMSEPLVYEDQQPLRLEILS